jgi:single-strand DNA-binding protein
MNKVTLLGRLGADPELNQTKSGVPVVNINVATSERWKDADGNRQERTTWHRCFMFGNRANAIAEYFQKGSTILLEGTIRNDTYEKDGITHNSSKIEISEFHFVDKKEEEKPASRVSQNTQAADKPGRKGAPTRTSNKRVPTVSTRVDETDPGDDELPY